MKNPGNICGVRLLHVDIEQMLAKRLGPRYAAYRKAWYAAKPDSIPDFPIHLDIELVDYCNQNCSFCARNQKMHPNLPFQLNTGRKMDERVLAGLIEEAKREKLMSIGIALGEPLMHPQVFQVVRAFHDAGVVDSRMITNGTLLHRFMDDIFQSGLVNLYVSIDALTEGTYRKVRGEGFQKVVDNLLLLLEEKKRRNSALPVTRVSFVEMDSNRHELAGFKEFWMDKVDLIDIQFQMSYETRPTGKAKKWVCVDPFRRLSVTALGEILPCCTFFGKRMILGDIQKMTLRDAWTSDAMKRVRDDLVHDRQPICVACQECG